VSVLNSTRGSVVRIFVGFSWKLCCQQTSKWGAWAMAVVGRQKHS